MPSSKKAPADRNYGGGWKNKFEDLECPSGEWCQVRRPGVQGLIKAGLVDEMDTLTGMVVGETIPRASGDPVVSPAEMVKDMGKVADGLAAMDKIVMYVVVQPKIHPTPEDDDDRDDDLVYIDDVALEDKSFILSYGMGGTRSLETFRAQSAQAVGSAPPR